MRKAKSMATKHVKAHTPTATKLFAVFSILLCLFVWIAPGNTEWRLAMQRYLAQRYRAQNIQRMMTTLRHDPEVGTLMPMASESDVAGKPLPRKKSWVLIVSSLSQCTVTPLREWEAFAQSRREPVIVITTSSAAVARLFQKEHHLKHLRFVSDPLIPKRPVWNVFMYPRLYLLDANRRLLWICQMPMTSPHVIPDQFLRGGEQ